MWNCFVCGGGDFIKFIKIMEKLGSTKEAIAYLKKRIGLADNFQVSFSTLDQTFGDFKKAALEKLCLDEQEEEDNGVVPDLKEISLPQVEPADKFFDIVKKKVNLWAIKKWGIVYCCDPASKYEEKYRDRLIVPIYYEGKLVTFAARDMSGKSEKWNAIKKEIKEKKYDNDTIAELVQKYAHKKVLYPYGAPTSYIFFNWDEAIKNRKYVIIVEGVFDAMKLIEYGFNAIALLSCHINDYRLNLLIEHFDIIYIMLDNDLKKEGDDKNPGQDAAIKIQERLADTEAYNVVLPPGRDPDECTKDEIYEHLKSSMEETKKSIYFSCVPI